MKCWYVLFKLISVMDGWVLSCEIVLKWLSSDLTDNQSTLAQVMAWCRQATNHYLSLFFRSSVTPYDIIRPQGINWGEPIFAVLGFDWIKALRDFMTIFTYAILCCKTDAGRPIHILEWSGVGGIFISHHMIICTNLRNPFHLFM